MSRTTIGTHKTDDSADNKKTLLWVIGGVVGLGLIVLLAASIAAEEEIDPTVALGPVEVTGQPLPFMGDPSGGDAALGVAAPQVTGEDFEGNTVAIEADGRPKIVIFLAHWCPHCQAEVPLVQDWIDSGGSPADVDLYSATIFTDHLRPNWSPQEWLEAEGWTPPVIKDDESSSIATAYGVRGTPAYIVLDGNNVNLGRFSGQVGVAGLEEMVELARGAGAG